jgi:hypothetical protein
MTGCTQNLSSPSNSNSSKEQKRMAKKKRSVVVKDFVRRAQQLCGCARASSLKFKKFDSLPQFEHMVALLPYSQPKLTLLPMLWSGYHTIVQKRSLFPAMQW